MSTAVKCVVFVLITNIFTTIMSKKNSYTVVGFIVIMFSIWMFSDSKEENNSNSESIKVVLREVGHQLLLINQDSTSLVLPILELDKSNYRITFENNLSIAPKYLVSTIHNTIEKSSLSTHYLVEVMNCNNKEVAYSYEVKNTQEKSIIPCFGRALNEDCYFIEIHFLDRSKGAPMQTILYLLTIFLFITVLYFFNKRREYPTPLVTDNSHKSIGIFKFYPDQNKLVKEATEISLSKKECELLAIFIANPNQIIKREELMKKVWEDHGVIVGRSLDTYISKLRKKLKEDTSIKLTNVHGVGYKLEISV